MVMFIDMLFSFESKNKTVTIHPVHQGKVVRAVHVLPIK